MLHMRHTRDTRPPDAKMLPYMARASCSIAATSVMQAKRVLLQHTNQNQ